jgi:hypothetical protein
MSQYSEDQQLLASLVKKHGVADVLGGIETIIKDGEKAIREDYDSDLGNAFDFLFVTLVEVYPQLNKKNQKITKMMLKSLPVEASLKIRKADSPRQSVAMKEAYKFVQELVD